MSEQHAPKKHAPKKRAPKKYAPNRAMKAVNAVMRVLAGAGLVPRVVVLTVRGRTSGEPHSTPVTPIGHGGAVWLVAPYGIVRLGAKPARRRRAHAHARTDESSIQRTRGDA